MKWLDILKGNQQEDSLTIKSELEAMREKHTDILAEIKQKKEACIDAQRDALADDTKETNAVVKKLKAAIADLEMKNETVESILPELEEAQDKAERKEAQERLAEIEGELSALTVEQTAMTDNFLDALAKAQALYHLVENQYPPSLLEAGNIFGHGNELSTRLLAKTDEYIDGATPVRACRYDILMEQKKLIERLAS